MYLQVLRIPLLQVYHRRYQHLFINLLSVVIFAILDYYFLKENHALGLLDNRVQLYFLLVVVFNHTIGIFHWPGRCIYLRTIVNGRGCGDQRLFLNNCGNLLYCVALNQAKGKLVEGSMIGSILGAVLLLPGLSMCGVHSNGKLRDTTRDLLVSPQQCYCMPWW